MRFAPASLVIVFVFLAGAGSMALSQDAATPPELAITAQLKA